MIATETFHVISQPVQSATAAVKRLALAVPAERTKKEDKIRAAKVFANNEFFINFPFLLIN